MIKLHCNEDGKCSVCGLNLRNLPDPKGHDWFNNGDHARSRKNWLKAYPTCNNDPTKWVMCGPPPRVWNVDEFEERAAEFILMHCK